MSAPLSLLIGHAPIASEAELVHLNAAELQAALQDSVRLLLPSGQDVLGLLAQAIAQDLVLVETTLAGDALQGLAGTLIIAEADVLPHHMLEALQQAASRQQELISALVKVGRSQKVLASRSTLRQALQGKWQPDAKAEPNPILEAAAAFPHLLRLAETAVAHQHSLIMRYETAHTSPVRTRSGFWRAQLRPLLVADLFALAFVAFALLRTDLWRRDGILLHWYEPVFTYLLITAGFLLPLWLAQLRTYRLARRASATVTWVAGGQVSQFEKERVRPFLLDLHPRIFILSALYQPGPSSVVPLPKPTRFYFTLFGFCLLFLAAALPLLPLNPWLGQFFAAFTVSALAFGLSHLLADK